MAAEDYFDVWGDPDEFNESGVACRRCGAVYLEWRNREGRWRLYDDFGKLHQCRQNSALDDFEDLGEKV
jgi:hypothetical protein